MSVRPGARSPKPRALRLEPGAPSSCYPPRMRAAAFFRLVEGVKGREENLKQQLRQLSIEIDESKRAQEVEKLTESTFFTNLKSTARQIRQQRDRDDG